MSAKLSVIFRSPGFNLLLFCFLVFTCPQLGRANQEQVGLFPFQVSICSSLSVNIVL